MKGFKLFLTSLLVLTLMVVNPVSADNGVIEVSNEDDFLLALSEGNGNTLAFKDDIIIEKWMANATEDSFIEIPDKTVIYGNDHELIFASRNDLDSENLFKVVGDLKIDNLNIFAPSSRIENKKSKTQTLFTFEETAKNITFSDVDIAATSKWGFDDYDGSYEYTNGVAIYFYGKDMKVQFNQSKSDSIKFSFENGSSGSFDSNNSLFSQRNFRTKSSLRDEIIYKDEGANWTFINSNPQPEKSFEYLEFIDEHYSSVAYKDILKSYVGKDAYIQNYDLLNKLYNLYDQIPIEDSHFNEEIGPELLATYYSREDLKQYGEFKYRIDGASKTFYHWAGPEKSFDLENGETFNPVVDYAINYFVTNEEHDLLDYYFGGYPMEMRLYFRGSATTEGSIDDVAKDIFGDKAPVVKFDNKAFEEAAMFEFAGATLDKDEQDSAVTSLKNKFQIGEYEIVSITPTDRYGNRLTMIPGNSVTITIPRPKSMMNSKNPVVYHFTDNSLDAQPLETTFTEDTITFVVTAFSNFMIVDMPEEIKEDIPGTLPEVDVPNKDKEPGIKDPNTDKKPEIKDPINNNETSNGKEDVKETLPATGMSTNLLGLYLLAIGVVLVALRFKSKKYKYM